MRESVPITAAGDKRGKSHAWRQWALVVMSMALVTAGGAGARNKIYQTFDENGNIVFQGTPSPDVVREIRSSEISVVEYRAIVEPDADADSADIGVAPTAYRYLQFAAPVDQAQLDLGGAGLGVRMQISPPLMPGHAIRLIVNGRVTAQIESLIHSVERVPPGRHTLMAHVIDADERIVAVAQPITVNIY